MEGQREIAFRPLGPARAVLRGGGAVEVPAGAHLRVRARGARPARLSWAVVLAEAPLAARARLEPLRAHYAERGVATATRTTGGVFGLGGRVVDNRRELLVAAGPDDEAGAKDLLEELRVRHGARPVLHAELARRPEGTLLLSAAGGGPLGEAEGAIALDVPGGEGFVVEAVEHDLGPKGRAREDRSYRGRLYVTVDAGGDLAAVHGVPLEELLRGLVPSEMPASSPMAALQAQAVTARSNVLAQLGTRHLVDPFMLCAEVHCQAYRGDGATNPRTDAAVRATRGEALFGKDGQLVDAVYSAHCGGHGEDNDKVWGNAPSPSLRGRPDLPPKAAARWAGGLADEARLRAFLAEEQEGWCRRAPGARRDRWRWERTLSAAALDALVAPLGVGPRASLEVASRGVSGRARLLRVTGAEGSAEVSGELRIRRLLGNLPSAMFVVDPAVEGDGVVLRGGGWGHGAGMCQWGAVGRASAGHDHRAILRAYFSGAEVVKVY
jgi:SpoIID/LytB domain protein